MALTTPQNLPAGDATLATDTATVLTNRALLAQLAAGQWLPYAPESRGRAHGARPGDLDLDQQGRPRPGRPVPTNRHQQRLAVAPTNPLHARERA